jgi:hypothetical protein
MRGVATLPFVRSFRRATRFTSNYVVRNWRLTAAIATPERDYQIKSSTNPFSRKLVGRRGYACGFVGRSAIRMPVKVLRARAGSSHRSADASLQNPMRRPGGKQCTKISQSDMFGKRPTAISSPE